MKILLLLGFSLLIATSYGQPPGMTDETWYLRYLIIDGETYYAPLGENLNLSFVEDNGNFLAEANGVENVFNAEVLFAGSSLNLIDPGVTLADCTSSNCPFEDQYFYEFLTTELLQNKMFLFNYNEYSQGAKDLWMRDSDFNVAYYTNQPITPDPAIFQTWYLYETAVDLGDPFNYYGPNVPRITIAPDFSFTGVNGSVNFEGHLSYGEDFVNGFKLILESLSDPNTGIPDLIDFVPLSSYVAPDEFSIESFAGFYSAFRNTITLGIPEHNQQIIILHPNPVQDKLFIEASEITFSELTILDVQGRLIAPVFENNSNEIDVSNLKAGMYFLKMESATGISIEKFIKR